MKRAVFALSLCLCFVLSAGYSVAQGITSGEGVKSGGYNGSIPAKDPRNPHPSSAYPAQREAMERFESGGGHDAGNAEHCDMRRIRSCNVTYKRGTEKCQRMHADCKNGETIREHGANCRIQRCDATQADCLVTIAVSYQTCLRAITSSESSQ